MTGPTYDYDYNSITKYAPPRTTPHPSSGRRLALGTGVVMIFVTLD